MNNRYQGNESDRNPYLHGDVKLTGNAFVDIFGAMGRGMQAGIREELHPETRSKERQAERNRMWKLIDEMTFWGE